jgi:hypothetical protein
MEYAAEMGSGAMIYAYIPSFRTTGSAIQKLIWGDYTDSMVITQTYFNFFQNEKSRLERTIIMPLGPVCC